jgi:hypothetical protein
VENLARKRGLEPAHQETGRILSAMPGGFRVEIEGGACDARRAASCMLLPEPGDLVLLGALASGACYVLAVLERASDGVATLTADGGLKVHVPEGQFVIAARDGVAIATAGEVDVAASRFGVTASEGSLAFRRLSVLSTFLHAEVERARTITGTLDSVAQRVTQRVKRLYRLVEEHEEVRAKRLDLRAQKTLTLQAQNAMIGAEQLVRIDGEQVRLG